MGRGASDGARGGQRTRGQYAGGAGRPPGTGARGGQKRPRVGCWAGERASGGGGRRRRRGWGSGLGGCAGSASAAAARARGAGGSAPELGHCGSRSPRLRLRCAPLDCATARARPAAASFAAVASRSSPPRAPRVRRGARGWMRLLPDRSGCAAAAGRELDCAGRPRPGRGSGQPRKGGVSGAGIAAVRASHLQPRGRRRGSPSAPSWGFPWTGTARGRREACSPGKRDTEPLGPGERPAGAGGPGGDRRVLAPGFGRRVPSGASTRRGPALCQPRAPSTRTHPRRARLAARPFSRRGEGGAGKVGEGAAGERQVSCGSGTRPAAFGVGGGRGARPCESGIDGVTRVTEGGVRSPRSNRCLWGSKTDRRRAGEGRFLARRLWMSGPL